MKPFREGKSRLAEMLPTESRATLSRQLFRHVLTQALASPVLAGILVVSRDRSVLDGFQAPHLHYVAEQGLGLNPAIHQGRHEAIRRGADAILVLPADLPRLASSDIMDLYTCALPGDGIVIVPSDDNGTNALLVRPPQAIDFLFGHNSFMNHCLAAQMANLPCKIVDSPHLRFDVDLPSHLVAQIALDPTFLPYANASSPQA
ncbi:MAG: 2-phospho-L-lactate guanylyltransferase [Caldilineaceae bacterium]|nr:2-phospho-L-lactate guanylyltransferase [Caldilineaceae bacterium]